MLFLLHNFPFVIISTRPLMKKHSTFLSAHQIKNKMQSHLLGNGNIQGKNFYCSFKKIHKPVSEIQSENFPSTSKKQAQFSKLCRLNCRRVSFSEKSTGNMTTKFKDPGFRVSLAGQMETIFSHVCYRPINATVFSWESFEF